MVKPETAGKPGERSSSDELRYKGVRKRKWGKYVSEIRLPNCRQRIWLGSYDSAEKAARAFDAALFCLRGPSASFNFPDNPPQISGGRSLTPSEIQAEAARYANSGPSQSRGTDRSLSTSSSSSSSEIHVESPSPSVSDGVAQMGNETETPLDGSFLDLFSTMGSAENVTVPGTSFDIYPDYDDFSTDFFVPPMPPNVDYGGEENNCDANFSQNSSYLWNF
ncbi:ethylene-responsive transcription factor ERF017 [Rhododendron vialii]|uniref:ethylene-responsive transcription factor ERF017 n=1 Tax=Rhododendron vialii TaxID=182163 RepID=UPI002660472A|nr:ethylene-responsive transcription factor ERF017 [Rhododendron vialii]